MPTFDRRLIPGVLFLTAGILLILHNFKVFDVWAWGARYWPLLVIGVGVLWAIDSQTRGLGVACVVIGSVFQASKLGILEISFEDLARFWPLILIAIGLNLLIRHRGSGRWGGGVILLTLGVVFQLEQLGWTNIPLWQLWPVALIGIGLAMLHRALQARKRPR